MTDGYHFTKPLELVYHHLHTYYFKIVCAIDDTQLLAGCALACLILFTGFCNGNFYPETFKPVPYSLLLISLLHKQKRIYPDNRLCK